jgi:hypothetical protein
LLWPAAAEAGPDVPGLPLSVALRRAARWSLIGFILGAVVTSAALALGWAEDVDGVAAIATYGMPPIRRGHRLRAMLAFAITTGACLVGGVVLLGHRIPSPWDLFIPAALAIAVGSQLGTAAAYLRAPKAS